MALTRLEIILDRLKQFRDSPIRLAGCCYDHSGVCELFARCGWTIEGAVALNDVVGIYGHTLMHGHVVVAGCGSWPQVLYVDPKNNLRWAGGNAEVALPDWLLSGIAYSRFLHESGLMPNIREACFRDAGFHMDRLIDDPAVLAFVGRAAEAAQMSRDVFWRLSGQSEAPSLVIGGGAVRGDALWRSVHQTLARLGVTAIRVTGDHAVGLVKFAILNPTSDAWGFTGDAPPIWLS